MSNCEQKFGLLSIRIIFAIAIFLFYTNVNAEESEDVTIPFDDKILSYAFKIDTGEIYGVKLDNLLFFFRVKAKYGCTYDILNTMLDTNACKMTIPSFQHPYVFGDCSPRNYKNYFDPKAFYYQFNNSKKYHRPDVDFTLFHASSPEIAHCFKKNDG